MGPRILGRPVLPPSGGDGRRRGGLGIRYLDIERLRQP